MEAPGRALSAVTKEVARGFFTHRECGTSVATSFVMKTALGARLAPPGSLVLSGQQYLPREEAVLERIQADGGLALRRFRVGAL